MNNFEYDVNEECYYKCHKFENNQIVKIMFQEEPTLKTIFYNIYLCVYNKRKSEPHNHLKITGKNGISTLLWAKRQIIEFEKFIITESKLKKYKVIIYTHWDNNARKRVYEYGLKPLKYHFNVINKCKVLCKTIKEGHR